jgi:hypothetical protein
MLAHWLRASLHRTENTDKPQATSYGMNDNYLAYMLRLKRSDRQRNWRATLENAHSGTVRHFASEEELLLYLMDRLAESPPASDQDVRPGLSSG